jgi:hypothetical protein
MRSKRAAQRALAAQRRKQTRRQEAGGDSPEQALTFETTPEVLAGAEQHGSAPWIEATPTSVLAPQPAEQPPGDELPLGDGTRAEG